MKNKEEPSANSSRGNPWVQVDLYFPDDQSTETTGSLSRPGLTAEARAEKPALREEFKDSLGRTCSSSLNRRMRTRMSGGVGRASGNRRPYPISPAFRGGGRATTARTRYRKFTERIVTR